MGWSWSLVGGVDEVSWSDGVMEAVLVLRWSKMRKSRVRDLSRSVVESRRTWP